MSKNKRIFFVISTILVLACEVGTNEETHLPNYKKILSTEIEQHVKTLSSKEFSGREVGTEGGRKAAAYIADEFKKIGLLPGGEIGSYFQTFHLYDESSLSGKMKVTNEQNKIMRFTCGQDYTPLSLQDKSFSATFAFVGYGITSPILEFDEYANIDVEDKIVIVFSGVPWHHTANHWFTRIPEVQKLGTVQYKIKNAEQHGASAVIFVENPIGWRNDIDTEEVLKVPGKQFLLQSEIPVLQITRKTLAKIIGMSIEQLQLLAMKIDKECKPQSLDFATQNISVTSSQLPEGGWIGRNVIGIIPGRDQDLKKEAVIIGAHYDHLGRLGDQIYYGANDNASGISAVISIAKAFKNTPITPKRTVIFIAFDAEEIGKLGSFSYVDKPLISLSDTTLMINFDMIGRNENNHIYAVASQSSSELHQIHQEQNKLVGLQLEHPQNFRLGKSDHTGFYQKQIPIIYFFGGKHEGYHRPSDTWELVDMQKIEKVARLAFLTAYEVANRKDKLTFQRNRDQESPFGN